MLEDIGIFNISIFINNGLKFIFGDQDMLNMIVDIPTDGMIFIYVEHENKNDGSHQGAVLEPEPEQQTELQSCSIAVPHVAPRSHPSLHFH